MNNCFCCKKEIDVTCDFFLLYKQYFFCSDECENICALQCILLDLMNKNKLTKLDIANICGVKLKTVFSWLTNVNNSWSRKTPLLAIKKVRATLNHLPSS